jgi:predicted unusual protein kinase regulating ubiquinone biosynthesis (AarF/ABC1/UbiB family)
MYNVFDEIFNIPDSERFLSKTMVQVFSVMRQHHVKMESNLAMLAVSMGVMEGLARKLDPKVVN